MLHKLFEEGAWFAPKHYGCGAGLPIARQGWMLSLVYCLAVLGIANAPPQLHKAQLPLAVTTILVLTGLFLIVMVKRTRGGWRRPWGERG